MGAALKTSLSAFVVIYEVYRAGETLKPRGLSEGTCDRLEILQSVFKEHSDNRNDRKTRPLYRHCSPPHGRRAR